jgi:hypothetical protein
MAASLVDEANRHVSYAQASEWAGVAAPRDRGARDGCPKCGEEAYKGYPDHGWCYACRTYFSAVSLLAVAWQLSWDDAAAQALEKIGWVPVSYAHLWEGSRREPEPDRAALESALKAWCAAACPDWRERQYDNAVAARLARCLGLLAEVRTEEDCATWLAGCQVAMGRVLGAP